MAEEEAGALRVSANWSCSTRRGTRALLDDRQARVHVEYLEEPLGRAELEPGDEWRR